MGEFLGHDQPVVPNQRSARGLDSLLTVGRQGDVGDAGVLAAQRPLRLAVADDEDPWGGHASRDTETMVDRADDETGQGVGLYGAVTDQSRPGWSPSPPGTGTL